ncbi:MAG: hypothetical protein M3003_01790 [Candidatus Dormibacteraeota bacterium]|nr:hypothetical protein [Candidatus Dormibacteraeota bacterium]
MLVLLLLIVRSLLAGLGSRRELMLENLALRHQLQVAMRTNPSARLRPSDRVLWVWLQGIWPDGWRRHLRLVRPETVLRWHRKGWRLYWAAISALTVAPNRAVADDDAELQQFAADALAAPERILLGDPERPAQQQPGSGGR